MDDWGFWGVPKRELPPAGVVVAPKGDDVEVLEETKGDDADVEAPKVLDAPKGEAGF